MSDGAPVGTFSEMNRWLAILLPLSMLGQTPNYGTGTQPVAPVPRTDEQDAAARDEADTATSAQRAPPVPTDTEVGFGGSGPDTAATGTTPAQQPATGTRAPTTGTTPSGGTPAQQPATDGGTTQPSEREQPSPEEMADQIQQLQGQVQSLQQQLAEREQQLAQNEEVTQGLQQDMGTLQSNAQELERMRQQRLAYIRRAWAFLLAADNALASGELAVDESLRQAELSLGDALANSASIGKNETVALMLDARNLVSAARTSIANRDIYYARLRLQSAGESLTRAQALSLGRSDVNVATPPPTESPSPAGTTGGQ